VRLSWDPVLEVTSTAPCEDWERAPPVEPSGRPEGQLWAYHGYLDPLHQESGIPGQLIQPPLAVAPDNSVWAIGPEDDRVMHVGADGRLLSFSDRLADSYVPVIVAIAVAPDGTPVFLTATPTGETPPVWGLSYGMPGGSASGTVGWVPREGSHSPETFHMVVGHHGYIYVSAARSLVATCRGEKRWELTDPDSGQPGKIFGLPEGGVLAVTSSGPMRIDEAGNVERLAGPALFESDAPSVFGGALVPGGVLLGRSDEAGTFFRYELWSDGVATVLHEADDPRPPPLLDAEGITFTFATPDGARQRRVANGRTAWETSSLFFFSQAVAPTQSGLVVMARGDTDSSDAEEASMLQLFDPRAPEMVWQLESLDSPYEVEGPPVYLHNGSRGLVLGYDGVAYVRASQSWNYYLIAYQTDQLPDLDHCLMDGCDPSNTGSIGLMR
jgi:hypothetical protein